MLELRHESHCVYKIRYHMVLCIKYRKQMLLPSARIAQLKDICAEIGKGIVLSLMRLELMATTFIFL